ncbi:MAG: class I SAM-dependent methyltransferase [Myxococcota bacterium]
MRSTARVPERIASEVDEYGTVTARYYDAAYAPLRQGADIEFYRELARQAAGPVLELGCGTGRVLLPIAELGIPCTGLDASPRMLEVLRRRSQVPTLRLVCQRMQAFDLGEERFTLIFSAFRALQHLYSVEDQLACLARVRRHLAPGGSFAFDVFAPQLERMAQVERPEQEDVRFELEGEEIVRFVSVRTDAASQILHVRMRYERRKGDSVLDDDVVEFRLRYFFRYELEHLLARAGFDDLEFLGGFDGRPYDYVSRETVVVASASS